MTLAICTPTQAGAVIPIPPAQLQDLPLEQGRPKQVGLALCGAPTNILLYQSKPTTPKRGISLLRSLCLSFLILHRYLQRSDS